MGTSGLGPARTQTSWLETAAWTKAAVLGTPWIKAAILGAWTRTEAALLGGESRTVSGEWLAGRYRVCTAS